MLKYEYAQADKSEYCCWKRRRLSNQLQRTALRAAAEPERSAAKHAEYELHEPVGARYGIAIDTDNAQRDKGDQPGEGL